MILKKDIYVGISLVCIIAVTFVIGFKVWPLFMVFGLLLFYYIKFHRKKLRCPNCGGFENLDRLSYAINHRYHCRHCGERIIVKNTMDI